MCRLDERADRGGRSRASAKRERDARSGDDRRDERQRDGGNDDAYHYAAASLRRLWRVGVLRTWNVGCLHNGLCVLRLIRRTLPEITTGLQRGIGLCCGLHGDSSATRGTKTGILW